MSIDLQVLVSQNEFESLAGEWNQLLVKSASHVPFLRHEYLTNWWRSLGGAEWDQGELHIVLARDGDGRLVGIAPLFFTRNSEGHPAMMLLGSVEISDYLDLIALPEVLPEFLERLLAHLASPQAPPWLVLDWYNILEGSPTLQHLEVMAARLGWSHSQSHYKAAPYIPLPGSWDAYLDGIAKKQRHEIRRKLRRATSHPIPVRWYIVEDGEAIGSEMDAFLRLMALDPVKAGFLSTEMVSQMQATMQSAHQADWLQLAFLEVGGEKAAGYLNFDYANRIWSYNSGWDMRFAELSPGWVLLAELLRWANAQRREAFDFLRGAEEYKYRFGAMDRFVERVTVRRG